MCWRPFGRKTGSLSYVASGKRKKERRCFLSRRRELRGEEMVARPRELIAGVVPGDPGKGEMA